MGGWRFFFFFLDFCGEKGNAASGSGVGVVVASRLFHWSRMERNELHLGGVLGGDDMVVALVLPTTRTTSTKRTLQGAQKVTGKQISPTTMQRYVATFLFCRANRCRNKRPGWYYLSNPILATILLLARRIGNLPSLCYVSHDRWLHITDKCERMSCGHRLEG